MGLEPRSSDAFKRTAEHAVRSNQTVALQPLSAALPDLSLISAPGRRQKWAALREAVGVTPAEWLSQHQNRRSALSGAKVKVDQRPHSAARPRIPLGEKIQAPVRTPASAVQRIAWTRQCLSLQTGGVRGQGQIALRSCAAMSVRTPQAALPERKDSLGQTRRQ